MVKLPLVEKHLRLLSNGKHRKSIESCAERTKLATASILFYDSAMTLYHSWLQQIHSVPAATRNACIP